uniref:F-box associated beta-propeller type 3 domain-containing protein n=1 Tax=Leersia perrieri TaxID=77586 RepID=A0A0D9W8U1_9ORYZ
MDGGCRRARDDTGRHEEAEEAGGSHRRRLAFRCCSAAADTGVYCDDGILRNIFSRLPTRAAVACTALSKRHRRMVTSAGFRRLHCLHGAAPLPRQHVAYLTTAPITRRAHDASKFHGFHVAGAGMGIGGHAPMRALTSGKYERMRYINTCNGVMLFSQKKEPSGSYLLWNPDIADDEKELTIHGSLPNWEYSVAGIGYGRRSNTYKVNGHGKIFYHCEELVVYTLGAAAAGEQPRTVLSGLDNKIKHSRSTWTARVIYLLYADDSIVFAFDVDDETVTPIDLPGHHSRNNKHARSRLMEMSGRACVATDDGPNTFSVWLLAADRRTWQRRCVIGESSIYHGTIIAAWDHGDVLVLLASHGGDSALYLYDVTAERMMKTDLPTDVTPETSAYTILLGLHAHARPESIIGDEEEEEEERRRRRRDQITTADVLADAVKPVGERDVRKGRKATLDVTFFMELLVRIMRKLPEGMNDLIGVPLLNASLDVRYRFPGHN